VGKIASSRSRSGIGSVQSSAGTNQFVGCGCITSVSRFSYPRALPIGLGNANGRDHEGGARSPAGAAEGSEV